MAETIENPSMTMRVAPRPAASRSTLISEFNRTTVADILVVASSANGCDEVLERLGCSYQTARFWLAADAVSAFNLVSSVHPQVVIADVRLLSLSPVGLQVRALLEQLHVRRTKLAWIAGDFSEAYQSIVERTVQTVGCTVQPTPGWAGERS
jgi:hypothetical protein